ncbi:MAG: Stp1/IreP family PP2C-type Ser/Thr phosphatase [Acidaminococcaceae bacterium]|nr:Stp1/IreP family PP2C-type Ser/Thr phosphatase [Acidaminococcaceae bacterium]
MSVAARTHIGRVRKNNEDSLLLERPYLFAIADGMGGYNAGEIASRLALDKLKAEKADLFGKTGFALVSKLYQVMRDINNEVYEKARPGSSFEGMGTTLSGIYFTGSGKGYVFNVGDSRVYLLRQNKLQQITRDHSLVAEMVEHGELTREEAFDHPQKNMLTRGIGVDEDVNGDVFVIDVYSDDIILLCSDGLTDMLHDKEIEERLMLSDTEAAADALLSAALEKGGRDNISFIILKLDWKEVEHDGR